MNRESKLTPSHSLVALVFDFCSTGPLLSRGDRRPTHLFLSFPFCLSARIHFLAKYQDLVRLNNKKPSCSLDQLCRCILLPLSIAYIHERRMLSRASRAVCLVARHSQIKVSENWHNSIALSAPRSKGVIFDSPSLELPFPPARAHILRPEHTC